MNAYLKSLDTWRGNVGLSSAPSNVNVNANVNERLVRSDLFELESASLLRYDMSGKDKKPPFSLTMRLAGNAIPVQRVLLAGTYVPISVSPATLVLTPSTAKLLNTVR
jgi:hypothetical protein